MNLVQDKLEKMRQALAKSENDKRGLQDELGRTESRSTKLELQRMSLEGDLQRLQMILQEKEGNIQVNWSLIILFFDYIRKTSKTPPGLGKETSLSQWRARRVAARSPRKSPRAKSITSYSLRSKTKMWSSRIDSPVPQPPIPDVTVSAKSPPRPGGVSEAMITIRPTRRILKNNRITSLARIDTSNTTSRQTLARSNCTLQY